jgi:hypothetical protein
LSHFAYRRPLACEVERFALNSLPLVTTLYLPLERFEVFAADAELMITRTDATRLALKPSLRPISSGEGTRFRMMYVVMETL